MKYRTLVIDPPWEYRQKWAKPFPGAQMFKTGGGQSGKYAAGIRGAASHYDCMTIDQIKALPVGEWADPEGCHLYLWTTNGFLREAFDLVDAWGFSYKTTLTWCKRQIGMGLYYRGQTEHVLFAVKGKLKLQRRDLGTWFNGEGGAGPRRNHSQKPYSFYDMVASASPAPRLDVFARRKPLDGWDVYGNEVYSDIPLVGG
jgi:N6-adenosine-specific RNA methylase IME4